jgi:hypothetical protein
MQIIYTNGDGVSVTLAPRPPLFLTKLDGTGNIHNIINTFHAPNQDGAFFISSSLDMRNITIEGTIVASNPNDAYSLRKWLLHVFTPKQQGTLTFRDLKIGCVVEDIKLIVASKEKIPNFFISLLCPSPFFEMLNAIRAELALWQPTFHFELEIPSGTGVEFGVRQPSQILTIQNPGDVSCGCQIRFSAIGAVTNPSLTNLDTGEYVKVLTTMANGDIIDIYTQFAGKKVVKTSGGTTSNAFSLLDVGSTFLQLSVGENLLRYDADSGLDQLEVSLFYSPAFNGL